MTLAYEALKWKGRQDNYPNRHFRLRAVTLTTFPFL